MLFFKPPVVSALVLGLSRSAPINAPWTPPARKGYWLQKGGRKEEHLQIIFQCLCIHIYEAPFFHGDTDICKMFSSAPQVNIKQIAKFWFLGEKIRD